jgi:hypothetical protein
MTTPTFVFEEDIFDVKDIDKEGKFFEKGVCVCVCVCALRIRVAHSRLTPRLVTSVAH